MTLQHFMELRELLSVAHHVRGRIRVKFDPRILSHPAAKTLASLSRGEPESGLLSARLNISARSLVLEYDPRRLSPEDFETFLTGPDKERADQLAERVANLLGINLETS